MRCYSHDCKAKQVFLYLKHGWIGLGKGQVYDASLMSWHFSFLIEGSALPTSQLDSVINLGSIKELGQPQMFFTLG